MKEPGRPQITDVSQHRWFNRGMFAVGTNRPVEPWEDRPLCWLWVNMSYQVSHMGKGHQIRRLLWDTYREEPLLPWNIVAPNEGEPQNCVNPWHCSQMDQADWNRIVAVELRAARAAARLGAMPTAPDEKNKPRMGTMEWFGERVTIEQAANAVIAHANQLVGRGIMPPDWGWDDFANQLSYVNLGVTDAVRERVDELRA